MKTSSFVTALILTATLGSLSTMSHAGEQDFSFPGPASVHSNVTRDAVRAEYFSAVKSGTQLQAGERDHAANSVAIPVLQMGKSRMQVQAEYFSAVSNGTQLLAGERDYADNPVATPAMQMALRASKRNS
jgi:hypothetical protein